MERSSLTEGKPRPQTLRPVTADLILERSDMIGGNPRSIGRLIPDVPGPFEIAVGIGPEADIRRFPRTGHRVGAI